LIDHRIRGDGRKTGPRFPLLLTTGRILSQYNVGAQTRRTENTVWHDEDVLEIHPHDAELRGVKEGTGQARQPLRRDGAEGDTDRPRQPRRGLHDVPSPGTQANVITTDIPTGPRTARNTR
jgi:formate dehydrogenase major subunit